MLFRSSNNEWGVAYSDQNISRLILASHASPGGVAQLIAAVWDGKQLSLRIDGRRVDAQPFEFVMMPSARKLIIGGIQDGVIPSNQGKQFFDGEVSMVRISRSAAPMQLAKDHSMLVVQPETLVLFDFREPTYLKTVDKTKRWPAVLRGNFFPNN